MSGAAPSGAPRQLPQGGSIEASAGSADALPLAKPTEGAASASSLNLTWITPTLAIAGELPQAAWPALATDGVRAVVDLRAEACDDAQALAAAEIAFLHLPTPDHHALAPVDLDRGVAFVREAGGGAVVHCREGVGRSALLALCVLVDAGAAPAEALALAKDRRWQVSPSPAQYEAWASWLRARRLQPPDFDAFAAVAYRHLAR